MEAEVEIQELKVRLARMEWVMLGITISVICFFTLVCLNASFTVPRFERIFSEMLGDKPLPALTQFVINSSRTGMLSVFVVLIPFAATIFLIVKRKQFVSWFVAFAVIVLMILISAAIIIGLFLPMITITTELGGQF